MHEEQQQMLREQQQMMEMMRTAAAKAEDEESTAEAAPPHLRPTETQKKETPLPPSQMPRIAPAAYARQANNGSIKSGYVPSMAGIGVTFREVDGLWQVSAIKPGFHEVRRTSSCVRAGALSA
jgi:anti-sigma factor RsiW